MPENAPTKLCIPVWRAEQVESASRLADVLEIRADKMELREVGAICARSRRPVLLTLRGQEGRENDLKAFAALEPDYLDLEVEQIAKVRSSVRPGTRVICSHHDFKGTPADLNAQVRWLKQEPADFYKLATYAHSTLDALRMVLAMQKTPGLIGLCMGPNGLLTRLCGPRFGAELCFASLSSAEATAPGQLTAKELLEVYHFRKIGPKTELLGLIADPFPKSFGYFVHNALFEALGYDAIYLSMCVPKVDLDAFFALARELPFRGLSVTMPLKEAVLDELDALDPEAEAMGAVNTVTFGPEGLIGFNEDGKGALDAIEALERVAGKRVSLIGAGGAARAVAHEALRRGAEVQIVNRSVQRAEELASLLGCDFGSLDELRSDYDILIQCTSVGMVPHGQEIPIRQEQIHPGSLVMDIVARPAKTRLLSIAAERGCRTISGVEMWINQALGQLSCWFGGVKDLPLARQIARSVLESLEKGGKG